jgi:hypothetical protein
MTPRPTRHVIAMRVAMSNARGALLEPFGVDLFDASPFTAMSPRPPPPWA